MASKKRSKARNIGTYIVGAGVVFLGAYLGYSAISTYSAKKKLDALKKSAPPLVVLETITANSPVTGAGTKSIAVTPPPVDPWGTAVSATTTAKPLQPCDDSFWGRMGRNLGTCL